MTQPYQPDHSPKSGLNSKLIFGIIIEETIAQMEKDAEISAG